LLVFLMKLKNFNYFDRVNALTKKERQLYII